MKFIKTAVAVAIAGSAAALPMIASADTTLSGAVQIQVFGSDTDGPAGDPTIGADDVLFGIATNHELNSGLTGYGSLRVDMNRLSNAGATDIPTNDGTEIGEVTVGSVGTADSVYVGMKGGFGDVRFGEIPAAVEYGQVANDIFDVAGEINGGISYTGTFGPVGLIANYSPENNLQNDDAVLSGDTAGVGAKFNIGGFSIGLGTETRDELASSAVGATFALAGASIAAHFWTQEVGIGNGNTGPDDRESFSVQAGYGFGGVSASLTFSTQEVGNAVDDEAIRLDLGYGLGGGMDISTRIQQNSDNTAGGVDTSAWRIKLSKSF